MTKLAVRSLVEKVDEPPSMTALNSRGLDALGIGPVKLAWSAGERLGERWGSCRRQKRRRASGGELGR